MVSLSQMTHLTPYVRSSEGLSPPIINHGTTIIRGLGKMASLVSLTRAVRVRQRFQRALQRRFLALIEKVFGLDLDFDNNDEVVELPHNPGTMLIKYASTPLPLYPQGCNITSQFHKF